MAKHICSKHFAHAILIDLPHVLNSCIWSLKQPHWICEESNKYSFPIQTTRAEDTCIAKQVVDVRIPALDECACCSDTWSLTYLSLMADENDRTLLAQPTSTSSISMFAVGNWVNSNSLALFAFAGLRQAITSVNASPSASINLWQIPKPTPPLAPVTIATFWYFSDSMLALNESLKRWLQKSDKE